MSWKIIAVVVLVSLAAVSTGPVNTCVLQKDTAMEQFKLSNLNRLFGEILTTESNGNIYVVSICHPIPKSFYDPRKLAGAIKFSSNGEIINLGCIDQTDVVVNENSIVLTYVGGDKDINSNNTCKGQRWTTYLTFECDPLATNDVLTLIDEDPDQPEICQVWFEIKTSKICIRQPFVPLNILENDLIDHNESMEKKKDSKKNETNSNEFSSKNETTNNDKSELSTSKNISNVEIRENNSNQNYSNNTSIELPIPFINTHSKSTYNNELINNKNNLNKNELHHDQSNKSSNNDIKGKQLENEEIKNHINSKDKLPKNNTMQDNENLENNSNQYNFHSGKLSNDKNANFTKENKPSNNENKDNDLNKKSQVEKLSDKINNNNNIRTNNSPTDKENKVNPHNTNSKDISNKSANFANENKPNNSENKVVDFNKNINEENVYNKENNNSGTNKIPTDQENNVNSHNINMEGNKYENENVGKENKPNNNENKGDNLNKNTPNEKSSNKDNINSGMNESPLDKENKVNPQNTNSTNVLRKNKNDNSGKKNKSTNYDHKEGDSNKKIFRDNSSNHESAHFKENGNKGNSQNTNLENKSSKNENNNSGNNNKPTNNDNKDENLNNNTIKKNSIEDDTQGNGIVKEKNSSINKSDNSLPNNKIEKIHPENGDNSFINETTYINKDSKYNYNPMSNSVDNTTTVVIMLPKNNLENTTINDNANQSEGIKISSTEKTATGLINNDDTNNKSKFNSTIINDVNKNVQTGSQSTPESSTSPLDTNKSSNILNNNNNNEANSKTTDGTSQSGDDLNFSNWFLKLFPNGIQLSKTSIIGGLTALASIYAVIGTAINRYYYKLTGTDQIPLKGTFQSIKVFITNTFCCCISDLESLDVTNEKSPLIPHKNVSPPTIIDETSSKSSSDDNYQRRSGKGNKDTNSDQNDKNGYGSISNESHSPTPEKKFRKKKRKSSSHSGKEKLINTAQELQGKSVKGVLNEKMSAMVNTKIIPKIGNILEKFGKKIVNIENEEKYKTVETISDIPSSVVSQLIDERKVLSNKNDAHVDEEIKSKNTQSHHKIDENLKQSSNLENFLENGIKNNTEEIKLSTRFDNVEPSLTHKDNSDELKGNLISKLVNELDSINFELNIEPNKTNGEGELVQIISSKKETDEKPVENKHNIFNVNTSNILETVTNELIDSRKNNLNGKMSVNNIIENKAEEEPLNESLIIKNKSRELKQQFLNIGTENTETKEKNIGKVHNEHAGESNITGKNIEDNDDESIEVIEEIVYIDGKDGDEDEEEIIEITETTTTVQESPEKLDEFHFENCESPHSGANKGVTTVTTVAKKTIPKPSSSTPPEEVTTSEETVVSSGTPEHNKNPFKFQLGIGKSGVNISVGEKQLGFGKSGVKFDKNKENESGTNREEALTIKLDKSGLKLDRNQKKNEKSVADVHVENSEKRDTISPEKVKKPKSNFKIFKRSTSQPLDSNIIKITDESPEIGVSKKGSRRSAGLMKFGISRSKSTTAMETDDIITTDVNVMSSFIDHERLASSQSIADLSEVEKTAERNGTSVFSGDFISSEKSQSSKVDDDVQLSSGTLGTDLKVGLPVAEKNNIRKLTKNVGKKSSGIIKKRGKK